MSQYFCLKWNNHMNNMKDVFKKLLLSEEMADVTLACDGSSLKAHKIVLSACSPFFQSLFLECPCKHPIVVLKDMKFKELKEIIQFMYHGEINVAEEKLSAILKTAETLSIKGFTNVSNDKEQSSDEASHLSSSETGTPPSKRKKRRTRKRTISAQTNDKAFQSKTTGHQDSDIEELFSDMDHNINAPCSAVSTVPSQTQITDSSQKSLHQQQSVEEHAGDTSLVEEKLSEGPVADLHSSDENLIDQSNISSVSGPSGYQDDRSTLVPTDSQPQGTKRDPFHSADENLIDQSNIFSVSGPSGYQDDTSTLVPTDSQPQGIKRSGDDPSSNKLKRRNISCPLCPYSSQNSSNVKFHILLKHNELDYLKHSKSNRQKYIESDSQKKIEPTTEKHNEPVIQKHIEPAIKKHIEPALKKHIEPALKNSYELTSMKHVEPASKMHVEPASKMHVEPASKMHVGPYTEYFRPAVKKHFVPATDMHTESVTRELIEPVIQGHVEPAIQEPTEPVIQEHIEPVIQKHNEPTIKKHVGPAIKMHTQLVTEYFKPAIKKHFEPVIQKHTEHLTEKHIEPVAQEHIESVIQEHTEPMIQGVIEPVIEDRIEPMIEEHIEPVTEEHFELVTEEHFEPVTNEFATQRHTELINFQNNALDNQEHMESDVQVCNEVVAEEVIELDNQEDEESESRFPCPFCLYSNRRSESLKLHIRRQHNEHRLFFID